MGVWSNVSPRSARRRAFAAASFLVAAAAVIGGCATVAAGPAHAQRAPAPAPAPAAAVLVPVVPVLTLHPAADAVAVSPAEVARAGTTAGTLVDVALTGADGRAVPGSYSPDHAAWTASAPLAYKAGYTWSGTAVAPDGTVTALAGQFRTVTPKRMVKGTLNIDDGQTVGVAAPIEVHFDRDLSDEAKATVERGLTVTTSVPVQGAWAWLPDDQVGSRVHWRPKAYWPANTQVSVAAPLHGLDLGTAGWGTADLSVSFTVGRSQIVEADEDSHRIRVIRDGQQVMDLPASYGLETDPRRVTRSGTHIVMSRSEKVLMSNPDYGYEDVPEYWAVRISNNGEYIHANPASTWAQGTQNVSHGCINLSTADARAYFATAIYGDPVEVTGSSVALSAADGDIYDWAIPWDRWTQLSALRP